MVVGLVLFGMDLSMSIHWIYCNDIDWSDLWMASYYYIGFWRNKCEHDPLDPSNLGKVLSLVVGCTIL